MSSSTRLHLIAAFVLLAALSFKVWMKVETIELGYKLAKQRELVVQYDMERRDLELQLSLLTRPDNLQALAAERLSLRPANMDQLVRIPAER